MNRLFGPFVTGPGAVGLLVLRVVAGAGLMLHGWPKIQNPFGWMPAGGPVPGVFQALSALAEFGGGLALILGLLTPIAAFGLVINMFVAMAMVHWRAGHAFVARPPESSWELAALYFAISLLLLLLGPGAISLDAQLFGRRRLRAVEPGGVALRGR